MANLYSCEFDGYFAYRERIALSDGSVVCCESNIAIPAGFPYADCRPWWSDDGCDDVIIDGNTISGEDVDDLPLAHLLPLLDSHPQAIEVWRRIRNDSANRLICPSWTNALQDYMDTADDTGEQNDKLMLLKLGSVMDRTRKRYANGLKPRLHPHEAASLASGEFVHALPYSIKKKETPGND